MSEDQFVTLERRDDQVALIRLDRPKMNALNGAVLGQLYSVCTSLIDDPPGAVVVWGGERIFAAGADIAELDGGGPDAVGANFTSALGALAAIPRVTIAAVNGYALGGGCELALACDLRIAGEDARFGLPEVLLGVIPGGGGTQRLPRLIGSSRAKELIFSGRQVRAEEALAIGLANRVAPKDQLIGEALAWAGEFARGPRIAHAEAKAAVDDGLEATLAEGLALEQSHFLTACRTEDAKRGITSFLENGPGKATFVGR